MSNSLDSFLTRIGDVTIERLAPRSSDDPGDRGAGKSASNPDIQTGNDDDSESGGDTSDGDEERKNIMESNDIQSEGSGDDMDLDETIDTEIGVRIDSERQRTPSLCQDEDDDAVNILDTLPLEGAPIEGQEVSEADLLGKSLIKDDDSMDNDPSNIDSSPSSPSDQDNQKRHAETDEESDHPKKQKKDDNHDDNESKAEKKLSNMRRNIREVMDETQLDEATLSAQRQEMERLRRVQEQQRMIREARQLAINRQNNKTQTRVMSLLQGKQNDIGTTLSQTPLSSSLSASSLSSSSSIAVSAAGVGAGAGASSLLSGTSNLKTPMSLLSSRLDSPNQSLLISNSSSQMPTTINKRPMESSRWQKGRNYPQQSGTSISRLPGRPPLNQSQLQQRIRMMTPSVSISPVVPKKENDFYSDSELSEPEIEENINEQDDDKNIAKNKELVTISSSSDDSDDDCIVLSEPSGGEETDNEDDPSNSGMHTNDRYNIPDEHGRVLINVGHPESEPDVYLAPQVAKIIKPHQIGGVRFLFDNIIESIERYRSSSGFGCILAHSMGLGKTLQVASFCDIFFRCTTAKTVLCIMPINTLQNWLAEFNMWLPYEDPELIKNDKQNTSSSSQQKNNAEIGKTEFKEENSNLTDVSSSMSSAGNHFNQQNYDNHQYNYQDNLIKSNTNFNQQNYSQNSMYANYPHMKQEIDCQQNSQMPSSNYPSVYPQMANQNYQNYHQNPSINPYQNYQQQQQQQQPQQQSQMPQIKTEYEENPIIKKEEDTKSTTSTTTKEESQDDKKESDKKIKAPFNVDAPIGLDIRPRHFKLHILNDLHKTMAARARVIKEWQKVGGVLLIGYELYRQLSLKKSNKGKRKRGQAFKEATVDIEEDDKNKVLFDDMHGALVDPGPDLVICDEGHRIKNSHASISLALKQMKTKRRIVLTGYPLQNNLLEYWCMVDFVRPNYLGTKSEFCNMFERPIQNGQCIDSTPQDIRLMRYRAHVLHALLEGFVQRRSHSVLQISLPRKEEYIMLVRMTPHQRKLYDTFMNQVVKTRAVPNPLKAFAVCCKIWNHPDILYHFLRKRQMNEEDDLDLEETIAEKTTPGMKKGPKGKTKKGAKKEKIIKNKPAASVQPNSSASINNNTNTTSTTTTTTTDDVNDNKKIGNFNNYTQVQNTNYPPTGNATFQQPQSQPQQQQQQQNFNNNSNNYQGNDNQGNNNYYRSETNTSEFTSEFYNNNQTTTSGTSGTRYQNQSGTFTNYPQGSSNYQATNSNQNYSQQNPNQMFQGNNNNDAAANNPAGFRNDQSNSGNNYDMFSRQQNYSYNDQSRNYSANVNQQQYQTNVNQSGNYQNQSNIPMNNFSSYNEHQSNSQIYTSQNQQQNSQSNTQQTSRYIPGQSQISSTNQQNSTGNMTNSYPQNQQQQQQHSNQSHGYQNSTTPGASTNSQIYQNSQGNNQGNVGPNGSQPFLGNYPTSQGQNSNLPSQASQNYPEQNSSGNFNRNNQGIGNFPVGGNHQNSFKGQDDRFTNWQTNYSQSVNQQQSQGNNQFYQDNYFPGQNNYQQNRYQNEYQSDINIKTEDGKPYIDNKKDNFNNSSSSDVGGGNNKTPSVPIAPTVVSNIPNIPSIQQSFPNDAIKEKDDSITQEKDKEKDDKSDDEVIVRDEDKDLKSSPSGREDPGIPYDWATDLMKGYVPDIIEASAKMAIFFCILEEAIRLGDRVLTFSQSLFTLNLIEDFLAKNDYKTSDGKTENWIKNVNYYRLDGSTSALEREKLINEFNRNSKIHLFLVSTRAGSLGINLVGANRAIVFDASWNPCHDTQAVCRVYRYGQKKPCYVYRLVTDNCLERKIYDRQISKQGMADRVVDQCNPDAHLSLKEATTLSWDWEEDSQVQDFSASKDTYTDEIMHSLLDKHSSFLTKQPFHHESLLVDRKDKKLSQAEKRLARRGYELEKMAANSSRPSYNYIPGNTATRAGGLQIRAVRGNDQGVTPKPVASVRPMQQRGAEGLSTRAGSRWIPAEVWQRQGMSAQEMTLPLDVVIPTNSPDKSSIVLKAGQRVMVLKSPKGIYMQLESGKIIAIRTSLKLNQQKREEETKKVTTTSSSSSSSSSSSPRGQNLKPDVVFPLRNNSAISLIPKTSSSVINTSSGGPVQPRPLSRPSSGSGYRQFQSDKDINVSKRPKSFLQTPIIKQNLNQLTNNMSLQKLNKGKHDHSVDHSSAGENSNSSDSQPRTDQRVEEVRIEDIVAEANTNNNNNNNNNTNSNNNHEFNSINSNSSSRLQTSDQQDTNLGKICDDNKRQDYNNTQTMNIHNNIMKNDLLDHTNKNIKNLQNMINSSEIKGDIRQIQSGSFGNQGSFGHSPVSTKNPIDEIIIDKPSVQNSMRITNQIPSQQQLLPPPPPPPIPSLPPLPTQAPLSSSTHPNLQNTDAITMNQMCPPVIQETPKTHNDTITNSQISLTPSNNPHGKKLISPGVTKEQMPLNTEQVPIVDPQGYPYAQYPRYYDYSDSRTRQSNTSYEPYYQPSQRQTSKDVQRLNSDVVKTIDERTVPPPPLPPSLSLPPSPTIYHSTPSSIIPGVNQTVIPSQSTTTRENKELKNNDGQITNSIPMTGNGNEGIDSSVGFNHTGRPGYHSNYSSSFDPYAQHYSAVPPGSSVAAAVATPSSSPASTPAAVYPPSGTPGYTGYGGPSYDANYARMYSAFHGGTPTVADPYLHRGYAPPASSHPSNYYPSFSHPPPPPPPPPYPNYSFLPPFSNPNAPSESQPPTQ